MDARDVMNQYRLELTNSQDLNADTVLHTYRGPEVAAAARPGQFVNLRTTDGTDPLLRRPISICSANPDEGTFTLLIKQIGPGSRLLGQMRPGTQVDMLAPLGTHFEWTPGGRHILVAGGVGVAPMLFLARQMKATAPGADHEIVFCYGARSASDFVMLDQIEQVADQVVLTTNDGSRGEQGFVTQAAEKLFTPGCAIYTCGPNPMMNDLLTRMRAAGLEGQVSLENMMGCGIGACQGCVVPTRRGYLRVCCEGPVLGTELLDAIKF